MTHRPVSTGRLGDQTNPVRPLRLEGSGRLLRKVTWQTTSCWQKRRATLGLFWKGSESENSVPFGCKQFCSAFHKIFFFVILAKFLCRHRHYYYFFFIQNKISIYMILSFLTMYRSAKKSSFITCVASSFPHPTLVCLQLAEREGGGGLSVQTQFPAHHVHMTPPATPPKKWSNMQLFFQHGPISRESKNIKTIVTIWNGYSRK